MTALVTAEQSIALRLSAPACRQLTPLTSQEPCATSNQRQQATGRSLNANARALEFARASVRMR